MKASKKNSARSDGRSQPTSITEVPEKDAATEFKDKLAQYVEDDKQNKRKQAEYLQEFMKNSGLAAAFQGIFCEILGNNVDEQEVFEHTAKRLKQIGKDVEALTKDNTHTTNKTNSTPKAENKKAKK